MQWSLMKLVEQYHFGNLEKVLWKKNTNGIQEETANKTPLHKQPSSISSKKRDFIQVPHTISTKKNAINDQK